MAMFGKALGNGYAITAVIGRRSIMEAAQSTFISSTFWGERIGPAAALKTLEVMAKERSWETITSIGETFKKSLIILAKSYKIKIKTYGIPALLRFELLQEDSQVLKTLITQEMLKQNYLASTSIYFSTSHSPLFIKNYFKKLNKVFKKISKNIENIKILQETKPCEVSFKRIN